MAFQTGFCAFVLSNYMKTLPRELYESAVIDGAACCGSSSSSRCRCAGRPLAALATLEVTWIYNEFFWATVLLQQGDKYPVTSSINNLRGQFFTDNNLVAAGSVDHRAADPRRSSSCSNAVRRRPDARRDQGMT